MKSWNTAIIVVGLLVGYYMYSNKPTPAPQPQPSPVVNINKLEDIQRIVAQADPVKVKQIGELFLAMGDIMSRIDPLSTSDVRTWIVATQTYRVKGTDLEGGIGLGPELNELFEEELGLEDRELSADEMQEVSELLKSLGQACGVRE